MQSTLPNCTYSQDCIPLLLLHDLMGGTNNTTNKVLITPNKAPVNTSSVKCIPLYILEIPANSANTKQST